MTSRTVPPTTSLVRGPGQPGQQGLEEGLLRAVARRHSRNSGGALRGSVSWPP
jgi:hypothetical protein